MSHDGPADGAWTSPPGPPEPPGWGVPAPVPWSDSAAAPPMLTPGSLPRSSTDENTIMVVLSLRRCGQSRRSEPAQPAGPSPPASTGPNPPSAGPGSAAAGVGEPARARRRGAAGAQPRLGASAGHHLSVSFCDQLCAKSCRGLVTVFGRKTVTEPRHDLAAIRPETGPAGERQRPAPKPRRQGWPATTWGLRGFGAARPVAASGRCGTSGRSPRGRGRARRRFRPHGHAGRAGRGPR